MFTWLRKFWGKSDKPSGVIEQRDGDNSWQLKPIYKDALGHTWYQLTDVEQLPSKRYAAIDVKRSYLEIGVDKFTFDAAIDMTKRLAENGDTTNIVKLWEVIGDRLTLDFNTKNILDLACTMFVVDDEKIYQFSEYYDDLKKDILEKDPEARSFFLTASFEIAKNLSEKYAQFSKKDLAELIVKEKSLNDYFGNTIRRIKSESTTT